MSLVNFLYINIINKFEVDFNIIPINTVYFLIAFYIKLNFF